MIYYIEATAPNGEIDWLRFPKLDEALLVAINFFDLGWHVHVGRIR